MSLNRMHNKANRVRPGRNHAFALLIVWLNKKSRPISKVNQLVKSLQNTVKWLKSPPQ